MFPGDELLLGDKYYTPDRANTREYLPRRHYRPLDIDSSYPLLHHTRLYQREIEYLERAKLRKASLGDIPTASKSTSTDVVTRSEFDRRIEEVTSLLMDHFRELSHTNLQKLTDMVSRNSQDRAERDRSANQLLRQMQSSKHEELERSIGDLEQRMRNRMDVLIEEVALTGRSFIEVREQVQRLSDTEGSLLRELNSKQQQRLDTAGTELVSFGDIKAIADTAPQPQLSTRIAQLESQIKEMLDRLNIHHNRLGLLTQRVDECKQFNLNTLLDFKQSIAFKLQTNEKRERKEYQVVCNTLSELTGQLRHNERQTDAVIDRINLFETMVIDREASLCLSQSLKGGRLQELQLGDNMKGSSELEGSIVFGKGSDPAELELSRPPDLSQFDDLNVQRGESVYKKHGPLEPDQGDSIPERQCDYNDDSLEETAN